MIVFLGFLLVLRLKVFRKHWFYGLAQDAFVTFELSFLSGFVQLFALCICELFLLFDAFLFEKIKTRFHPSHIFHLRQAASFWDSAVFLGLYRFFAIGAVIIVCTVGCGPANIAWGVGVMAFFVALAGHFRLSPQASYSTDNALFRLQLEPFLRRKKQLHPVTLPPFLVIPTEQAAYVSPQFPLLKQTQGFSGSKRFSISCTRPNIVFLFLESFRALDVNSRTTPFFHELRSKGVYFSQFYSNGVLTHQAIIASLFGLLPFFGCHRDRSLFNEPRQQADFATLPLIGLPALLKKAGYNTAYIDAALALESEKQFYRFHDFDVVEGRDDFSDAKTTSWGVHDEYLMRRLNAYLKTTHDRPLFTVGFTVSNHHPWIEPQGYAFDRFDDVEDEVHRKFLRTLRYSDHCLERFFEEVSAENTVFFIMGDHGQGMGEHGLERLQNSVYEENIHIPLLIVGPEIMPQTIDEPASQIDLLPTVMDMLDLTGINHAMGKSLLRPCPDAPVFFNNSHIGFSLGCRAGSKKYVMTDLLERKEEMFDLAKDPCEKKPLDPDKDLRDQAQQCYDFMFSLFSRGNIALTAVQTLDLSGQVKLTDEELAHILEERCRPYSLNLSGCLSITDQGLKAIAPYCTNLRSLNISQCMVTEKGLKAIRRKARHLEKVDTTDCLLM